MKPILILGGAKCVWDDIKSLGNLECPVAAVNDIGAQWPFDLVFWASLHPRKFEHWERDRQRKGYSKTYAKYGNRYGRPLVDFIVKDWGGSSGLFAVKVALELGFDRIVVAGIPMEASQAHFFEKKKEWKECEHYRKGWVKHFKVIQPFVRSCSGWTKALLGSPTSDWFI